MWIADRWKEYKVLDTGNGERLEKWGDYILVRPDPCVIWPKSGSAAVAKDSDRSASKSRSAAVAKDNGRTAPEISAWHHPNARYIRSKSGGGHWDIRSLPEIWTIRYDDLTFSLKPFSFKHTGLFPEQAANWDWMRGLIRDAKNADPEREIRILNLFAYTGGATCAAAAEGAAVTHVDAARGMVTWAHENIISSGLADAPVRWIVDDCVKFVNREIRRGNHYDGILMDPPSYGRGPKGEIWKLEESVYPLVASAVKLLSDRPLFFLLNSYTTGLQAGVLSCLLAQALRERESDSSLAKLPEAHIEADELGLPVASSPFALPCGASGRVTFS